MSPPTNTYDLDELELRTPAPVDRDNWSDGVIRVSAAELLEAERSFLRLRRPYDNGNDYTNDDMSDLWRDGE